MSLQDRNEIARERANQINKNEQILFDRLRSLEARIYNLVISEILTDVKVDENDIIKFSPYNLNLSTRVRKVMERIEKEQLPKISETYLKHVGQIQNSIFKQYESFIPESTAKKFIEKKNNATLKAIGIIEGRIEEGGFLQEAFDLNLVRQDIQKQLLRATSGSSTVPQLKESLETLIKTSKKTGRGVVVKRIYNQIAESYTQLERAESKFYADEIGLEAFIYFGSVINTTRGFCQSRAGKVFTTQEALNWKGEVWQGKPINYQPLVDLGGYNCRHYANYITNQEAVRRRPDLTIRNGKLVKK